MSGYRGRLLFPFEVEIARLDLAATAADPDGPGPLVSGFDDDFREPVMVPTDTGAVSARKEMAAIRVPCQVEEETEDEQQQRTSGNDPDWVMRFVFHFQDLESMGLVDANGTALIKVNDRATAIYNRNDGSLCQRLDTSGSGLYCISAVPHSYGLTSQRRNLLVTTFKRRGKAL